MGLLCLDMVDPQNQDCCKVIRVEKYDWSGEVPAQLGVVPFDIILGTDVAYYEHLYDPFIRVSAQTFPLITCNRGNCRQNCSTPYAIESCAPYDPRLCLWNYRPLFLSDKRYSPCIYHLDSGVYRFF